MNTKTIIKGIFLILVIGGAFGIGVFYGRITTPPKIIFGVENAENGKPDNVDFSLFWEAWHTIENNYVERESLDYQKMVYGAISGMVQSLGDPYTVFFTPEDSKIFKEDMSGNFEGVGMEVSIRNNQLTVISPLEGTPAFKAGLQPGDIILAVNGTSTMGMSLEKAVKLIRGPKGTPVTLTIMREGWQEPRDFTIIRDKIKIPSIKLEFKENNIAYVRIYHFAQTTAFDFVKAGLKILSSNTDKIILDLRNNPGGFLEVAQGVAAWFLESNKVVAIEDFGPNKEKKEYKSVGTGALRNHKIVILVNKGTASASEILAAALREHLGAKLVGEKTFGKGSIQELKDLKEGSLKVTVARWLTPKGEAIEGKGLEPDIVVEMTQEDINQGKDPQLEKAIELLTK